MEVDANDEKAALHLECSEAAVYFIEFREEKADCEYDLSPAGRPTATTVPLRLLMSTAVLKAFGEVAKQATACDPPFVYFVIYVYGKGEKSENEMCALHSSSLSLSEYTASQV